VSEWKFLNATLVTILTIYYHVVHCILFLFWELCIQQTWWWWWWWWWCVNVLMLWVINLLMMLIWVSYLKELKCWPVFCFNCQSVILTYFTCRLLMSPTYTNNESNSAEWRFSRSKSAVLLVSSLFACRCIVMLQFSYWIKWDITVHHF